MRVFVILNETESNPHTDVHNALRVLSALKVVNEYAIFPFLTHLEAGLKSHDVVRELVQQTIIFQPDAILWMHTAGIAVTKEQVSVIRQKCNNPIFGYWDGDLYERPYKPLPAEIVRLASSCEVVFAQGFGPMTDELAAAGCTDIRFVPGTTDEWRFGKKKTSAPQFDVVLIGNDVSSRLPWRTMPGARFRKSLVKLFEHKLGPRFAVFGHGWSGRSAQGPLPFDRQSEAYGSGRIALGVNNLHAKYYFSNRLPIAMSSGLPVVYNYEQGIETLLPRNSGCFFYLETNQAWALTRNLLASSPDQLLQMGDTAYDVSTTRFTITKMFQYICEVLKAVFRSRRGRRVRDTDVLNPWLDRTDRPSPVSLTS